MITTYCANKFQGSGGQSTIEIAYFSSGTSEDSNAWRLSEWSLESPRDLFTHSPRLELGYQKGRIHL